MTVNGVMWTQGECVGACNTYVGSTAPWLETAVKTIAGLRRGIFHTVHV